MIEMLCKCVIRYRAMHPDARKPLAILVPLKGVTILKQTSLKSSNIPTRQEILGTVLTQPP